MPAARCVTYNSTWKEVSHEEHTYYDDFGSNPDGNRPRPGGPSPGQDGHAHRHREPHQPRAKNVDTRRHDPGEAPGISGGPDHEFCGNLQTDRAAAPRLQKQPP